MVEDASSGQIQKVDLAAVAHHEAGHATACFVQRLRFKTVSIIEDDESLGRVHLHTLSEKFFDRIQFGGMTTRDKARANSDIIVLLAGERAEANFTGKPNPDGAETDMRHAVRLADALRGSNEQVKELIEMHREHAEQLVKQHWQAVQALAEALINERHLSHKKAKQIMSATVTASAQIPNRG